MGDGHAAAGAAAGLARLGDRRRLRAQPDLGPALRLRTADAAEHIDIVYFDSADTGRGTENATEAQLAAWQPEQTWSVRNMARMHIKNREAAYRDTADAIAHWLETPTAVAISMAPDDSLRLIAPHGTGDLLAGRVRPTPNGQRKIEEYRARVTGKAWPARWPCIRVEGLA